MRLLRLLALAFLDALSLEVPPQLARWMPGFLFASRGEREAIDRLRDRLK